MALIRLPSILGGARSPLRRSSRHNDLLSASALLKTDRDADDDDAAIWAHARLGPVAGHVASAVEVANRRSETSEDRPSTRR
jgi:hypothetical protein